MMISTMCKAITIEKDYEFLFGTLSAKNCKAEDISSELNKYNLAYKNLLKRKEIQKFNQGTIRKIEITYNWKRKDFNLHIHFLMAVRKQYFKSRHYLSSEKWLALWQSVMKDETITNIHIQKAKTTGDSNAYLELAKYSAKTSDLLENGQDVFNTLMDALTGRQLITYNAIFKEYKKKYVDGELNKYKEIDKDLYVFWIHSVWSLKKQDYENKITKMDISETIETSKG
ncbi:protein rep, partial [Cutibacterium acnes]